MDDFVEATAVERLDDRRWGVMIREDWALWGPAGGFLSALVLRAVGEATHFRRPISFACQFLNRAQFAPAEVEVHSLRAGKRTEALRADLVQQDKLIITAQVWVGEDTSPGMVHDYSGAPVLPDPETLRPYRDVYPGEQVHPFLERLGYRPIDPLPHTAEAPASEPEISGFFRLAPRTRHYDPFVDAARVFLLVDTYAWLATYPAHPTAGPSPWIAPNLDFYYRFHRPSTAQDWLHLRVRADLAEDGLIAAEGEVRARDGCLLARGASQLMYYPRPA
jgi:acyl-CoA thioesterase